MKMVTPHSHADTRYIRYGNIYSYFSLFSAPSPSFIDIIKMRVYRNSQIYSRVAKAKM